MKVYGDDSGGGGSGPVRVGVADYAVTCEDTTMRTSGLGSCVGVAVTDADATVAGLAHVMLPSAPESGGDEAKFADTAVAGMLSEMRAAGADVDAVTAKVAGGSRMLDLSGVGGDVGERNVAAVRDVLDAHDVPVVAADTGGTHGRSLELDTGTATLVVTSAHEAEVRL